MGGPGWRPVRLPLQNLQASLRGKINATSGSLSAGVWDGQIEGVDDSQGRTMNFLEGVYMGVSENSVPLNPMVNDHYPY